MRSTGILASFAACGIAHAEVVYSAWQNINTPVQAIAITSEFGEASSTHELPGGFENESQVAQRITLAGTSRHITTLEVRIGGFRSSPFQQNATLTTTVRFFNVVNGLPGTELWSGTAADVSVGQWNSPGAILTFQPNTTVPNTFFLSWGFDSIAGQAPQAQLGLSSQITNPSIGQADPLWAVQETATGVWSNDPFGPAPLDFQARINAIPAPGTGAVMLTLVYAVRRRRG